MEYVEAWEKSNQEWYIQIATHAIDKGNIAISRLLRGKLNGPTRSMISEGGSLVTDTDMITKELLNYHKNSMKENSSVPPGKFVSVKWKTPFSETDRILVITNELVADCIRGLKNSSVPDTISPVAIKLMFGASDLAAPLGEMIRAIARTRAFPDDAKVARQIFCWK